MNDVSVCILDYGTGNVRSVENMISFLGYEVFISNDPGRIKESTHLILPGVGAFGTAMDRLREMLPISTLENEVLGKKKPFLGICVGMQLLADVGYEHGEHVGLGWISGEVVRVISKDLPLPHVGWNDITILRESPILAGLNDHRDFYFLHSYMFSAKDSGVITSNVEYGTHFCSSIQKGNIFGVQFHPEKSQKVGQLLFRNFLEFK